MTKEYKLPEGYEPPPDSPQKAFIDLQKELTLYKKQSSPSEDQLLVSAFGVGIKYAVAQIMEIAHNAIEKGADGAGMEAEVVAFEKRVDQLFDLYNIH